MNRIFRTVALATFIIFGAASITVCPNSVLSDCSKKEQENYSPGSPNTPEDLTYDADWFVSPAGNSSATGALIDPIDLATALNSSGPVESGDLVVLLEGTYPGRFVSTISGTADAPIKVSAYPGKRVTIDGKEGSGEQALYILGEWVQFIGLEITNSSEVRDQLVSGVRFDAPNSKLINCVIHNNAQGVGFWRPAIDSELYGNIIFNNGYPGETRGHGHGIYTQNQHGTKQIRNNILFFGFGFGIQAYTEGGYIQGFNFEKNIWFRTGASVPGPSVHGRSDGLLIGGLQPVDRAVLKGNLSWVPVVEARSVRFGWGGGVTNEFIEIRDNYFVGNAVTQGMWNDAIVENNSFYGATIGPQPEDFPNNLFSNQLPTGTKTVLHPNSYDPERIDIVIYNWNNLDAIAVDPGAAVALNSYYRIYSVFDLWGGPVTEGLYKGGSISIPMGTREPPQPNGYPDAIVGSDNPGKQFGVFVMHLTQKRGGNTLPLLYQLIPIWGDKADP
jgi:hypothetical protein